MIAVKPIDDREIYRFYGRPVVKPFAGYAARQGLRTVAIGGLIEIEGRVWGFIDFRPGHRLRAIYRYMLRVLDEAKASGIPEIFVARDASLATSERLLTRAGFERTGEEIEGHEIWAWRNKEVL